MYKRRYILFAWKEGEQKGGLNDALFGAESFETLLTEMNSYCYLRQCSHNEFQVLDTIYNTVSEGDEYDLFISEILKIQTNYAKQI
jgi:hypothetical protein